MSRQIREALEAAGVEARGAEAAVEATAPVGIATTAPPWMGGPPDIPMRVQETALAFFAALVLMVIGWPIARAMGRRIERAGTSPKIPSEVSAQLAQLNQAVESIAIEVERISEGQRFTTKLLAEQHPPPPAEGRISGRG